MIYHIMMDDCDHYSAIVNMGAYKDNQLKNCVLPDTPFAETPSCSVCEKYTHI